MKNICYNSHKGDDDMIKKADIAKLLFLFLYFLILTAERIISLVTMFTGGMAFDPLDRYMIILTVCAIAGAYAYIAFTCRIVVAHGANGRVSAFPSVERDLFGKLAVAAGILLFGGMVHTDGTIPPLQFAAYGMILISMAIHTAQLVRSSGRGLVRWTSFGYIVAFSMAIPVVYHTGIQLSMVFIPLEIVVSAGMVILFTVMLRKFYSGDGICAFPFGPFVFAVFGDAAVLALRWSEEINFFVLIFICVAAAFFVIGKFISREK